MRKTIHITPTARREQNSRPNRRISPAQRRLEDRRRWLARRTRAGAAVLVAIVMLPIIITLGALAWAARGALVMLVRIARPALSMGDDSRNKTVAANPV